MGDVAVNESQTFNKPYNNFSYEPPVKKPQGSSKMETYEVKDSYKPAPMKDDFFEKMMKQDN